MSKKTVLVATIILCGMFAALFFILSGGDTTPAEGAVAGNEGSWNAGHINAFQEGTGVWVLTSTEASKYDQDDLPDDCYHSQQVTVGGLSATTSVGCSGTDYDVYQQTQHSWSAAPPERLSPGEMLRITSTASVEGTFGSIGLGGGASSWVRIDLVPGGGPYPGAGWASATEETTPASAVSEFTIPSGSEGGLMLVMLQMQSGAGSGQTTYTYEWQETATGATVAPTVTEPIAPAETAVPRPTPEPLEPCDTGADAGARFSSISKEVEVFPESDPGAIFSAKPNTVLHVDDHVLTGEESHAVITFADLSTLFMKEESEVIIDCPGLRSNRIDYRKGTFWLKVKKLVLGDAIEAKTNLATFGIKGTTFVAEVTDEATTLKVIEGEVEFTSLATGEAVMVATGETVTATAEGLSEMTTFDVAAEAALWNVDGENGNGASLTLVVGVIVVAAIAVVGVAAGFILVRKRKQTI